MKFELPNAKVIELENTTVSGDSTYLTIKYNDPAKDGAKIKQLLDASFTFDLCNRLAELEKRLAIIESGN